MIVGWCGMRKAQVDRETGCDLGLRCERVTRIELAFSAWEPQWRRLCELQRRKSLVTGCPSAAPNDGERWRLPDGCRMDRLRRHPRPPTGVEAGARQRSGRAEAES